MKSFMSVLLISVILTASCTARNIDLDNDRERRSPSSEDPEELLRQIEAACYEKTGSNQTFAILTASFAKVPICFLMKLDVFNLMDDLDHLNASTRHAFFPKFCPQIRNAVSCLESPTKQLSQCLDGDILQLRSHNASLEVLDLICANDGEILFQRGGANYEVCMQNITGYFDECIVFVTSSTKNMAVSKYGEAQCRELAKSRNCLQRKFNECNGPSLIDVMNVYYRAVLKDSPCINLAETFEEEDDKMRNETV